MALVDEMRNRSAAHQMAYLDCHQDRPPAGRPTAAWGAAPSAEKPCAPSRAWSYRQWLVPQSNSAASAGKCHRQFFRGKSAPRLRDNVRNSKSEAQELPGLPNLNAELDQLRNKELSEVCWQVMYRSTSESAWRNSCNATDIANCFAGFATRVEDTVPSAEPRTDAASFRNKPSGTRVEALLEVYLATLAGGNLHSIVSRDSSGLLRMALLVAAVCHDANHPNVSARLTVNNAYTSATTQAKSERGPGMKVVMHLLDDSQMSSSLSADDAAAFKSVVDKLLFCQESTFHSTTPLSSRFAKSLLTHYRLER